MKNIKRDIQIKLEENIDKKKALSIGKQVIREKEIECKDKEIVTIYIQCPDVSDLIIADKRWVRHCTDKEWGKYFNNILYPKNI